MNNSKNNNSNKNQNNNQNSSSNLYDDGNIPNADLPKDVIPDEVPRKDGPGGETGV